MPAGSDAPCARQARSASRRPRSRSSRAAFAGAAAAFACVSRRRRKAFPKLSHGIAVTLRERRDDLPAEQLERVEVVEEVVLEHDAVDAGRRVLAQPRDDLVRRADDPRLRDRGEVAVDVGARLVLVAAPLGEAVTAGPEIVAVGADDEAVHEREAQRRGVAAGLRARAVEREAALARLFGRDVDRVVLVGPPRGERRRPPPGRAADDQWRGGGGGGGGGRGGGGGPGGGGRGGGGGAGGRGAGGARPPPGGAGCAGPGGGGGGPGAARRGRAPRPPRTGRRCRC